MSEPTLPEITPQPAQAVNLPPLSPGSDTSEYKMALKIQAEANNVAKLGGALALVGTGLIVNPVTAPIGAILAPVAGIAAGLAQLVSWFVGVRYMRGRVDVKTATATALKLAEDISAAQKAIQAARK